MSDYGYDADSENGNTKDYPIYYSEQDETTTDETTTDEDETTTDEEDEINETNAFFSNNMRSSNELTFILKHALKHHPTIPLSQFKYSLQDDRNSNQWNTCHEYLYNRILRNYENY